MTAVRVILQVSQIVYRKLDCPGNESPTFMREQCGYLIHGPIQILE